MRRSLLPRRCRSRVLYRRKRGNSRLCLRLLRRRPQPARRRGHSRPARPARHRVPQDAPAHLGRPHRALSNRLPAGSDLIRARRVQRLRPRRDASDQADVRPRRLRLHRRVARLAAAPRAGAAHRRKRDLGAGHARQRHPQQRAVHTRPAGSRRNPRRLVRQRRSHGHLHQRTPASPPSRPPTALSRAHPSSSPPAPGLRRSESGSA